MADNPACGQGTDRYESPLTVPHRRLRFLLDLEADSLDELNNALRNIGHSLLLDEQEVREVDSGGWASGYHLELTCDEQMDGDTYRSRLREWADDRRAKRRAAKENDSG